MSASVNSSITPSPSSSLSRRLIDRLEDPPQVFVRASDAETDQPDRRAPVEDHHEDETVVHHRYVHVVPFPLVEQDRKLLLPDQRGKPSRRRDVPGGQRGKRGGVEARRLPRGRHEGAVLVDQEYHLRVRVGQELLQDRLDLVVFLLVENEMARVHSRKDTTAIREGKDIKHRLSTLAVGPGSRSSCRRSAIPGTASPVPTGTRERSGQEPSLPARATVAGTPCRSSFSGSKDGSE